MFEYGENSIFDILTLLLLIFVIILIVPLMVFWAIDAIFNFKIIYSPKTVLAFWILYITLMFAFKSNTKQFIINNCKEVDRDGRN